MRWLCKIAWYRSQARITIPKRLAERYGITHTSHVILDDEDHDHIKLRRFVYGPDGRYGIDQDRNKPDR